MIECAYSLSNVQIPVLRNELLGKYNQARGYKTGSRNAEAPIIDDIDDVTNPTDANDVDISTNSNIENVANIKIKTESNNVENVDIVETTTISDNVETTTEFKNDETTTYANVITDEDGQQISIRKPIFFLSTSGLHQNEGGNDLKQPETASANNNFDPQQGDSDGFFFSARPTIEYFGKK